MAFKRWLFICLQFCIVVLGRFLFAQLAFPLTNDLYTFCAGFYALYGVARVSKATITFMTSLPLPQIASEITVYTVMVLYIN